MKQFKMPSKREFQAMYPPENDAFDCAVRATLDALPENSPNRMRVKRKMSVGLAAAVILVLALTCAAVAAGLGVLEGWRSKPPTKAIRNCIARWMKKA